jgi:hypothetical protein
MFDNDQIAREINLIVPETEKFAFPKAGFGKNYPSEKRRWHGLGQSS